ncbi:MAG: hypothetical protein J6A89_04630 [Clostridia bacterium]|nr:hypothetical protein [Clostridia bacterium]
MNKKIICISAIVIIFMIIIFFIKFNYKKINFGNNESNKSADEVKDYILNINSYTAEIEVTINSNKNTNKYVLKQEYVSGNMEKQTVLKPENIEGVEICYKDGNVEISNSKLNLSKIYNNYQYLSDNVLWLNSFAENCKNNLENVSMYEENEYVVIELNLNSNKYLANRKLYLEKGTGKPKKMIVQDDNKKDVIYILYKEIELNK